MQDGFIRLDNKTVWFTLWAIVSKSFKIIFILHFLRKSEGGEETYRKILIKTLQCQNKPPNGE
ncbi:unnamed protein product, partial [Trichobilharzia szidati]